MAFYITSDTHFGHENICGENGFVETRKHFKDADEMNDAIIKSINKHTDSNDVIYHLGDIGFGKPNSILEIVERIDAKVIFIRGNHDNSKVVKKLIKAGYEVNDVGIRHKQDGKIYLLTHYPLGLGNKRVNIRNICGHIHETEAWDWNAINIGVDSPEIAPLGLEFGQPVPLQDAIDLVEAKWEENMKENLTEEEWLRYGGAVK